VPLKDGCTRAVHSENVAILRHEGLPEKQAVAIAFKKAKLYAKAHGKRITWMKKKPKKRGKRRPSMRGAKKRSLVKAVKPTSLKSRRAR
jgi:uncharacterized protein YdaT